MKERLFAAALALAALGCTAPSPGGPGATGGTDLASPVAGVEAAIARVYPTLVRIHVVWLDYSGGRESKYEASGSGTIISPDGLVVTNHHVAGRATLITCTLQTKEEIPATRVGGDPLADIAVLRLDLGARKDPAAPVPVASFGRSSTLQVGETVLAMGCPLALSQSVTRGIVSNVEMIMPRFFGGGMENDGEDVGSLVKWIGHDAAIFPGNSGGPLVNLRGEIVGVNEIGVGLGGAIPADLARDIVDQLIARGEVHRSWTGIQVQPLLHGSGLERGVLVSGVLEGGPAAAAGLRAGDVMLSFHGVPLTARFDEEIPRVNQVLLETPVGSTVDLVVLRDGAEATLRLSTRERGRYRGDEEEFPAWGIAGSEITPLMAVDLRREPGSGVHVSSLRDGGPASGAKPPVEWGDVITAVEGKEVRTLADLRAATAEAVRGRTEPVPTLIALERRRQKVLTVVRLGPEPEDRSTQARKAWFPSAFQVLTTALAEKLGLKGRKGVRITEVWPGTEVEAAGFRVGDVLVALDGDPIQASQPEDVQVLSHMVRQKRIGATAEFTVFRDGQETRITMALPARPPEGRELASWKDETFDFTVRQISFRDRVDERWTGEQEGVVVSGVEPGGWAAFAGLRAGDLVVAVDGTPVTDVDSMKKRMGGVERERPEHVVFQVRRGISGAFVEVRPAWKHE